MVETVEELDPRLSSRMGASSAMVLPSMAVTAVPSCSWMTCSLASARADLGCEGCGIV